MKVLQTLSLVAAVATVANADVCRMSDQSKLEALVMTDEFFVACEELAILNVTPNNVCVKPKCRDFFKKLVDKFPTCVNPDGQTPKSMWENALKKCGDATPSPALRTVAPTNAPEIAVSPTKLPPVATAAPGTSIPARKTPAPAAGSDAEDTVASGSDKKDASPVVGGDSPIAAPIATKAAAAKTPAPTSAAASSPVAIAAMGVVSVVCSMLLL